MKTLIAVPCMDQVAAPFAQSLATIKNVGEVIVSFNIGSLVYAARNQLTRQALELGADHILWLDSDMMFPQDLMVRLLEHMEQGRDIVSGLYFRRRAPFTPVLYERLDREGYKDLLRYPEDSVFEVAGCGFGAVMTRVSVMEDVALNCGDWFTPMGRMGEDLSFCLRARDLGYKIWADSCIKCAHIGQVIVDEAVYKSAILEA